MGAAETLTAAIDQVIAFFNNRRMDLPDGLFERKTQFVINGAAFETLLGQSPNDPLILMLSRGPAGYRFTAKALQHAVPDAQLQRGELASSPQHVSFQLWLSGTLRDTNEAINTVVDVSLRLGPAGGSVDVAEARVDGAVLEKIRRARRS